MNTIANKSTILQQTPNYLRAASKKAYNSSPISRMSSHQAAWLVEAKANPLKIDLAPYTAPGPHEIVVRNAALGLNHIDWKIQSFAMFPMTYPVILGQEIAGTVVEVGSAVSRFKQGDRIMALCARFATKRDSDAAYQEKTVISENIASHIPETLSFETAAGLPLGIATAAAGLFQQGFLELQLPGVTPQGNGAGKTILIWGGASCVGSCAIQLAVAAGYNVITTASTKNFPLVKRLGVKHTFDYNDSDVVDKIVAKLNEDSASFIGALDAINGGGAAQSTASVVSKIEGGRKFLATVSVIPEGLPKNIQVERVTSTTIKDNSIGKAIFEDFLPSALAEGRFTTPLETVVAGKGLEKIQSGLDQLKKGISATKLVVVL